MLHLNLNDSGETKYLGNMQICTAGNRKYQKAQELVLCFSDQIAN